MNIIPDFLRGAFHLSDWESFAVTMPPDDYTPIEVRFNKDPAPIITNGRTVRRMWDVCGKPEIPMYWRLLVKT